jgi:flavoprotein
MDSIKKKFTGQENDLKEAALILYNLRKREKEVQVSPYLSRNDKRLKSYQERADQWIERNIKTEE